MIRNAVRPGWDAVLANWRPFLLIQGCAAALVFLYYTVPAMQSATVGIAALKVQGGFAFSALASAFAGGILPEIARRITRQPRTRVVDLLFQVLFFAGLGMLVDALYRILAMVFGQTPTPDVVLKKVLVDQLIFSPGISIFLSTVLFCWKEMGFRLDATLSTLSHGGFSRRYMPLLISCWAFWIPVLSAVYSMPANLQFVLFFCTQAAWSILLVGVTGERAA